MKSETTHFFLMVVLSLAGVTAVSAFDLASCTQNIQVSPQKNWLYDLHATRSEAICLDILLPAFPSFSIFASVLDGSDFQVSVGAVDIITAQWPAFQDYVNWPQPGYYSYGQLTNDPWPTISSNDYAAFFIPRPSATIPAIKWVPNSYSVSFSVFTLVILTNSTSPLTLSIYGGSPYSQNRQFPFTDPLRNTFTQSTGVATVGLEECPWWGQSGVMVLPDWLDISQITGTFNLTISFTLLSGSMHPLTTVPVTIQATGYTRATGTLKLATPDMYRVVQATPLLTQGIIDPEGITFQWDIRSVFQGVTGIPAFIAFDAVTSALHPPCNVTSKKSSLQSWFKMSYDLQAIQPPQPQSSDFWIMSITFGASTVALLLVLILLVGILLIRPSCFLRRNQNPPYETIPEIQATQ